MRSPATLATSCQSKKPLWQLVARAKSHSGHHLNFFWFFFYLTQLPYFTLLFYLFIYLLLLLFINIIIIIWCPECFFCSGHHIILYLVSRVDFLFWTPHSLVSGVQSGFFVLDTRIWWVLECVLRSQTLIAHLKASKNFDFNVFFLIADNQVRSVVEPKSQEPSQFSSWSVQASNIFWPLLGAQWPTVHRHGEAGGRVAWNSF